MPVSKTLIVIGIIVVVVIALALILFIQQGSPLTPSSGGETGSTTSPTMNTTSSPTGLRTIPTRTRETTSINTTYICSLKVIQPLITLTSSRDPETEQLRVSIIVEINKTVEERVLIKRIIIDNPRELVQKNPEYAELIDDLSFTDQRYAPTRYTSIVYIPKPLESDWESGTYHTITIYYEYMGVECKTVLNVPVA